jgi:hypothetical protein
MSKWKGVYKENKKIGNTRVLAVYFCPRWSSISILRHIRLSIAERIIAKYLMTKEEYEFYKAGNTGKYEKPTWRMINEREKDVGKT